VSADCTDEAGKIKHNDNPFIEPVQTQTIVDMKGKAYCFTLPLILFTAKNSVHYFGKNSKTTKIFSSSSV
jgi:hypothetical protein